MSGSELHNCIFTFAKPDHIKGIYTLPASSLSGTNQAERRGREETNGEPKSGWWAPRPHHPPCPALGKVAATSGFQFLIYLLTHYKAILEICTAYLEIIKNVMSLCHNWCKMICCNNMTITLHRREQEWLGKHKIINDASICLTWTKVSQERKGWGTQKSEQLKGAATNVEWGNKWTVKHWQLLVNWAQNPGVVFQREG